MSDKKTKSNNNITLGLSQIVKNEAHVIERSLNSIKDIVDYITIVDTGSTDNTKEVIENWCNSNNIPFSIHDRAFDSFENSRNYAMEMAKDKTDYSFWLDADEVLVIDKTKFNKNSLDKDLYMFTTHINNSKYTRNELWSNKKDFKWYGPVHEYIIPDGDTEKTLDSGLCPGIDVIVRMDGGSWKSDISTKYRSHAELLERYIETDRNPRWVFYTAQSYHDSASVLNNKEENDERLRRSLRYYKERIDTKEGYGEERYYSQFRMATVLHRLNKPWSVVKEQLMKAYKIDPMRAEPFKLMVEYYQQMGDWNTAYLYSHFAYHNYHKSSPYPHRILFVDNKLYEWQLLQMYVVSCFYVNKKEECKIKQQELLKILKEKPQLFDENEAIKIKNNSNHFLK